MAPLSCPSRSFQDVYLRRSTGGYYTRARWPVQPKKPDHELISGKPCFMLVPVFRLFLIEADDATKHREILEFPRDRNWGKISVGVAELDLHFDLMPGIKAVQNDKLDVILEQYRQEGMSSNPQSLAKIAHRYAMTMRDSQVRCLLELMARELDKQFPNPPLQPLAPSAEDVVK